jgi:exodeoxyribonuclease V alpha subunit
MAQKLRGIVNRISFHNEESGFTVLRLEEENTAKNHTCVGVMPAIEQGESVCVTGEWTNDKRFGLQFSVQSYERVRPTTIEGILQFLQSGLICDIGPVRAMRIVETFGTETLNILDTEPQRLREVPGIGVKRQKTILDAWQKQQHIRDLVLFLQQYDISINLIHKIYKMYGEKAREVVTTNPYQLIEDIWGVGFKKAE